MRKQILVVVMLLQLSLPASAALVTINQTVDLNIFGLPAGLVNHIFASPVTLSEGDELILNYTFLPGQRLRMEDFAANGPSSELITGWVVHDGNPPNVSNFTATGTFVFTGLIGAIGVPLSFTQTSGSAHFGLAMSDNNLIVTGQSIEFSGFSVDVTVNDFTNPGITTLNYTGPMLILAADQISVVPEPASLSLLGLGLAGLGFSRRKQ